jgi:putative flippase GtrA
VTSRAGHVQTLVRHQAGALVATAVDFGTMIFLVEVLRASPVLATALGAACGAFANFAMSRGWVFPRHEGTVTGQAGRYAAVSAGSLLLNTLGEALVHGVLGVPYVLARAVVAVLVSVAYNFPLHRAFVFRERAS